MGLKFTLKALLPESDFADSVAAIPEVSSDQHCQRTIMDPDAVEKPKDTCYCRCGLRLGLNSDVLYSIKSRPTIFSNREI